jgi:nitrous oxidase accessory protein NosD
VAQDGSGRFGTIADAVAAASPGDVIVVRPGTYDESITLDKTVSISGDGDPGSVVISPSGGVAAFTLVGSDATISGLALRGSSGTVVVSGGAPTLEALHLEGTVGAAIQVDGASAARIRGNTIVSGGVGILVTDGSPLIAANVITANDTGVLLGAGAEATLKGNTICGNGTDVASLAGEPLPDRSDDEACPS